MPAAQRLGGSAAAGEKRSTSRLPQVTTCAAAGRCSRGLRDSPWTYKILYNPEWVLKAVIWAGSARRDVRAFAKDARRRAGYELYRVQQGLDPTDWKPMPSVGRGFGRYESTRTENTVIYVARFEEAIYVLHAFEKKTRKTRRADIDVAGKRTSGRPAGPAAQAGRPG